MVHKPIAMMILPVFVAGILMLGILAATGYAQGSSNNGNTEEPGLCFNEHTKTWQTCGLETSPQKHESSKTQSSQESSNNGKTQESSNTGQSSAPATTITPQFTVTPKAHITATNEQLSNNGKATTATPTGPTVAPRVEGAKGIEEVQALKLRAINEASRYGVSSEQLNNEKQWFDPKTQDCEGGARISSKDISAAFSPATGKILCSLPGKIITREGGTVYKIGEQNQKEQKAMHPSLTAFLRNKDHGAALASTAGLGGLVRPAGHLAKTIQKVGGETLEAGKALLGIKGK